MISRIRKKLTLLYSVIFGFFLLGFIGIICAGIVWTVYTDRNEEIKLLAKGIAREQRQTLLDHRRNPVQPPAEMSIEDDHDISGQVFYYVLDDQRQLVKVDMPVPVLRQAVYAAITEWTSSRQTKLLTIPLSTENTATIIVAEESVFSGSTFLGTVYVGRDVTAYARVLMRGIIILITAAILFFVLAVFISYYLAGRVIVPIEQSIERQKQFVADASHELRNPMSVLLTSIEGVEMDKDNVLSPFSRQILADAKDEFTRLKRLVNDLLTLARMDAGDIRVKKENFCLDTVAEQVIRSLRAAAERKRIRIQLKATTSVKVCADPERIHQLLYILVENAVKYSHEKSKVAVKIERSATGVEIVVTDNGPGIRSEHLEQIFERFYRVDESRSRAIEGSGLGLSIAQAIVNAHQGKISVDSSLGEGTQFIVSIPIN